MSGRDGLITSAVTVLRLAAKLPSISRPTSVAAGKANGWRGTRSGYRRDCPRGWTINVVKFRERRPAKEQHGVIPGTNRLISSLRIPGPVGLPAYTANGALCRRAWRRGMGGSMTGIRLAGGRRGPARRRILVAGQTRPRLVSEIRGISWRVGA